jgi:hypothetical protein
MTWYSTHRSTAGFGSTRISRLPEAACKIAGSKVRGTFATLDWRSSRDVLLTARHCLTLVQTFSDCAVSLSAAFATDLRKLSAAIGRSVVAAAQMLR